jgi:hypothetical protein
MTEPTTSDLLTAIREVGARVDGVDVLMQRLEARFEHLEGRFEHLEGRLDGVHTRLDAMATRIDRLIDAVADVRVKLGQHRHDD